MNCAILATLALLALALPTRAQVGIGTATPAPSAALDLSASDKGLLIPRLTQAQRTAIQAPAVGLLVFQMDGAQPGFWYFISPGGWTFLNPTPDNLGNHAATQNLNLGANLLTGGGSTGLRVDAAGNVGIGTSSPAQRLDVNGSVQVPVTSEYRYAAARTRSLAVPPAAFSLSSDTLLAVGGSTLGDYRRVWGGTPGAKAHLYAPLYLPHGARVVGVTFYVYENDATYAVSGNLMRQTPGVPDVEILSSTPNSVGYAGGVSALYGNTFSTVVDNSQYTYYLRFNTVQGANDLRLYGARIDYTVTKAD